MSMNKFVLYLPKLAIAVLSVVALSFASCEKVMEFDIDGSSGRPVLNALPSLGKQMFVNYSYSHFFLDNNVSQPIPNTEMRLSVNGVDLYPSRIDGCNYFFDYFLQPDDRLDISVSSDGNSVSASTYVPRSPNMFDVTTVVDTTMTFNTAVINFDIQNHPDYKEYYYFTISQRDSGVRYNSYLEIYDTVDTVYNTFFFCFDQNLTSPAVAANQPLGGYLYTSLMSQDDLIDGESYKTAMMLILLVDTNEIEPFLHQYTLNVESVTPERYQYLQSVSSSSDLMSFFGEPAPVYSNVSGALGIFSGMAKQSFPLSLSDTLPGLVGSAPDPYSASVVELIRKHRCGIY